MEPRRQPQTNKGFSRPKNNTGKNVQKSRELSDSVTPLIDDPLWKESLVDMQLSGFARPAAKQFHVDAAGYINLIEEEYKVMCCVEKYYRKYIPASAHAYYHGVLYWFKLAFIAQAHGTSSYDQNKLIWDMGGGYDCTKKIAAGAADYLRGLGDFKDTTGVPHVLVATEPNDKGHYGPVTVETHGLYETTPAPAVLLQRVIEDVRYTMNPEEGREDWLPQGVMLAVDESNTQSKPTANLLGWRRPAKLTRKQLHSITTALPDWAKHVPKYTYCINRELLYLVQGHLENCRRYKVTDVPMSTTGSIVQQLTWSPMSGTKSLSTQFTDSNGVILSRVNLPSRLTNAALLMCYRAIRPEFEDGEQMSNPWSCFYFDGYRNVPDDWRANRNTLIERGIEDLINYTPFRTYESHRSFMLSNYFYKCNVNRTVNSSFSSDSSSDDEY